MNNFFKLVIDLIKIRKYLPVIFLMSLISTAYSQPKDSINNTISPSTDSTGIQEKKELRMSFEAFKINHEIKLLARVRSKVGAKFQNTAGVEISFYKDEVKPENLLGKDTSNHKGECYWMIPLGTSSDSMMQMTFWAAVLGHPDFEDVEETITALPSVMTMTLEEQDSSHLVKIFVGHPDETGQMVPLPDAECKIFVKREFGLLPVGESETTDEEGNINVEFPADIHGDESGLLTIIAKVTENEMIGNVEVSSSREWGIPSKVDDFYTKRELWSARSNSPIPLIIVVNGALLLIWGCIIYIFFEIFRINKLGKAN